MSTRPPNPEPTLSPVYPPTLYPTGIWASEGFDQKKADSLVPGEYAALAFGILFCLVSVCVACWYVDNERAKIEHHDVEVRKTSYEHWHKPEVIERHEPLLSEGSSSAADENTNRLFRPHSMPLRKMQRVSATPELPGDETRISAIPGAGEKNPMYTI